MKEQHTIPRSLRRAAAATTLIGLAAAVSAAPAQATSTQASATVVDQVLAISGTNGVDDVTVDFTALDSVAVDLGDGVQRFDPRTFRSVSVSLGSGDDSFRTLSGGLAVDVPMTISGGSGDDVLLGGARADLVIGDRGADFVNGRGGTDTELLGSGDDTAAWNPGEGNDAVVGGLGRDTLLFNGSDGDEVMSLRADGTNAVFLRSPGSIRMDLAEVERLDLNTLGGVDAVTIGDLTGTGLGLADIDLASSGGTGENKIDTVVVEGTDRADRVAVTAYAGAVDVSGLAARTVVSGSEPEDRLRVNTFDGNDQLDVDPAVDALITFAFDLGAGQL